MNLRGKSVLVTGGSRGVGRAIVEAFVDAGAVVTLTYRTRERDASAVCEAAARSGGRAVARPLDVRDPDATRRVLDEVAATEGLDVVVANAGITHDGFALTLDPADFADVLDVNLRGAFHTIQAGARTLLAGSGSGAIVAVGSVAGLRASPGQSAYAAAKAGLVGLTRTMARELAPRGIRLNAVVGGVLDTGMAARLDHRARDRLMSQVPVGRPGTGAEIAAAVRFVASDEASYVVGHTLVVDGGMSL